MSGEPVTIFAALIWAHLLFDYALQGDFLSRAKNERAPLDGVPWLTAMWSHAFIQAGPVVFITGSWTAGVAEFCAHVCIDRAKCCGLITFNQDQLAHIACKAAWVGLVLLGAP